jgi:hypothetical protein
MGIRSQGHKLSTTWRPFKPRQAARSRPQAEVRVNSMVQSVSRLAPPIEKACCRSAEVGATFDRHAQAAERLACMARSGRRPPFSPAVRDAPYGPA